MATIQSKNLTLICLVLALVVSCSPSELKDDEHSRPIRELILEADKLYITEGRSPDFFSVEKSQIDLLANTLEITSFQDGYDCLCNAEVIFYFYKDDTLIMALGHHYNGSLRWHDADWIGDADLSKESQKRLLKWRQQAFVKSEKLTRGAYVPPALE